MSAKERKRIRDEKRRFRQKTVEKLVEVVESGKVTLLDVMRGTEFTRQTISNARHGYNLPKFETCLKINEFLQTNK